MSNTTDVDRAYAAGFIDGEGTIQIVQHSPSPKAPHRQIYVQVQCSNTYFPVIEWLKETWGGSIFVRTKHSYSPAKPQAMWKITTRAAATFLEEIEPYLREKRPLALNALAYQRTKRGAGHRMSQDEWASADAFLRRSREIESVS